MTELLFMYGSAGASVAAVLMVTQLVEYKVM